MTFAKLSCLYEAVPTGRHDKKKRDLKRKDFWPIFFQFCFEGVPNLEGIKVKNPSSQQIQESKKELHKCTNHNRNISVTGAQLVLR